MRKSNSSSRGLKLELFAIAATLAVAVLGIAYALATNATASASPGAGEAVISVEEPPVAEFPLNDSGQTYGTFADAGGLSGDLPDLIAAEATNGESGFIRKEDFYASSNAASSQEEAAAIMAGYRQSAIEAFCAVVFDRTGVSVDAEAFGTLLDEIYLVSGVECSWFQMSEQQKAAVIDLLPEGFDTAGLAQEAWAAAIASNDVSVPVYASDGVTVIGELIVQ